MATIPYRLSVVLRRLAGAGYGPVRPASGEYRCRCPAHDDASPSLYARDAGDKILLRCGAGCDAAAVAAALDLDLTDLFVGADDPEVEWEWDGDAPTPPDAPARAPGATPTAASGLPALVYDAVLDGLELSAAHEAAVLARGLTPARLAALRYRTADPARVAASVTALGVAYTRDELLAVPGVEIRDGRPTLALPHGLVVPVRAPGGAVVGLKIRRDGSVPGGPKYVLASTRTAPASASAHVPLGVTGPVETVRVTEGEIKADVATALSGLPTVGVPGVGQWALAVPVLHALGAARVRLAMDRDGKAGTLAATIKALEGFATAGFVVEHETWDAVAGKGIDDLLAGGGTPEVLDGLSGLVRVKGELTDPPAAAAEADPSPAAFPLNIFPPPLAAFAAEAAAATATPPDFVGVAMLVAAGAAVGNSTVLELKPGAWAEGACLFAGIVGDPAAGKTPALDLALAPLQRRQSADLAAYRTAVDAHRRAEEEAGAVAAANRGLPPAERASVPVPPPPPGPPRRCLIADTTVEATVPLLEANPRGLLKKVDEGSGLRAEHGQYKGGRGTDRQFYLSCWSQTPVTVDRKSMNGVPLSVERPFLAILFGIQPDMLADLGDHRGRSDGDLDRKLWAFPERLPAADWSDAGVTPAAEAAWASALDRLFAIPLVTGPSGGPAPTRLRFTPDGKAAWESWFNAHAAELRDPALPAALVGPWAKFRSHAARLALIVHLLWRDGDVGPGVGADAVERAARLVAYFQDHARRVYARLRQAPEDGRLQAAVDWVRRKGGRCTARDLLRAKLVADAEAARKLLREFVERGYGRLEAVVGGNGRRVDCFEFEPA